MKSVQVKCEESKCLWISESKPIQWALVDLANHGRIEHPGNPHIEYVKVKP